MDRVIMPKINESVPRLGMGVMRFPMIDKQKMEIDRQLGTEMIDYAMQNGINYFDTAYGYHKGDSEIFLGEALKKYNRNSYFIATKLPLWKLNSIDDVNDIFYNQLLKLQTDYIDFYLLHNWESDERFNLIKTLDVINYLDRKKKEGKIKYLGFSYHDVPEMLEKRIQLYDWDFVQLQINYFDWEIQRACEACEIIKKHNLALIAMEPVRGGLLAQFNPKIDDLFNKTNNKLSPSSYALKWVGTHTSTSIILSGMSNIDQLIENTQIFDNFEKLTYAEDNIIKEVIYLLRRSVNYLCTKCGYCLSCPMNIMIPDYIAIFNDFLGNCRLSHLAYQYRESHMISGDITKCIKCNECVKKCPQKINVPEIFSNMVEKLEQYKNFK